jgi:hypothetical protein
VYTQGNTSSTRSKLTNDDGNARPNNAAIPSTNGIAIVDESDFGDSINTFEVSSVVPMPSSSASIELV